MRTIFYIDGFNLYYGLRLRKKHKTKRGIFLKTGKYKWLDLEHLCRGLRKHDDILAIKYFSAKIKGNGNEVLRQEIYWKALTTTPIVEIIEGKYLVSYPKMELYNHPSKQRVQVIKNEEKGTDVNIACHMIIDAYNNNCDIFALITNDSDLTFPVKYIRDTLNKKVLIYNPHKNKPSTSLKNSATGINYINDNMLLKSQFPKDIQLKDGTICSRPAEWV